jgi:hypothetical protein
MARTESTLDTTGEQPEVLNATRARQGSRGMHILWVLVISIALAAVVLFGSLAFHEDDIDGPGGQTTTQGGAISFDTVPGSNQTPPSAP